jgi:hypothetical protein
MQISDGIRDLPSYSATADDPEDGLPIAADMHPVNAGLAEDLGAFPTMIATRTAENEGTVEVAKAGRIGAEAVDGDIEGTGNMPLVEFVGGAQVHDDGALLKGQTEFVIAKSKDVR